MGGGGGGVTKQAEKGGQLENSGQVIGVRAVGYRPPQTNVIYQNYL